MKQAILITSFGTTVREAREENIFPLVERVKEKYPDWDVFLAFTSRIVIGKLKRDGIEFLNEIETMEQLVQEGYERIVVQPTHLVGGQEFEKLKNNISRFLGQGSIQQIDFGRPLFAFMGQEDEYPDDYGIFIDTFLPKIPAKDREGILLVGHGGLNMGNAAYSVLQLKLFKRGLSHVRIATLENFPEIDDVALPWEWYDGTKPSTVHVHPLLLVAGDHALNDLFGDEDDSVVEQLQDAGFAVVTYPKGLGAYKEIQDLYLAHLEDAMAGLYKKGLK